MGLYSCSTSLGSDFAAMSHFMDKGVFSWGSIAWSSLDKELWQFEREDNDHGWFLHNSMLSMVRISQGDINYPQVDEQFDLVGSLTIWFIWKACCKEFFESIKEPPVETVMKIWLEIIHTL